jgi:hypothetical protein
VSVIARLNPLPTFGSKISVGLTGLHPPISVDAIGVRRMDQSEDMVHTQTAKPHFAGEWMADVNLVSLVDVVSSNCVLDMLYMLCIARNAQVE